MFETVARSHRRRGTMDTEPLRRGLPHAQNGICGHPPRRKRRGFLRPLGLLSRDGFGGFLPQPPYFSGGPRRGFTFGLPAHRSFGHKKYRTVRKEKKERPYILGLKTPRLFLNSYTMDSGLRLPPSTIPCEAEDVSVPCRRSQTATIIPRISRINSLLDLRFSHQASGSKSPSRALATRTSMPRGKTCRKMYRARRVW